MICDYIITDQALTPFFIEQIKERLGIRAKGRKIHGSEDEYQLREGQADYGGWQDLDNENTFDWNLTN